MRLSRVRVSRLWIVLFLAAFFGCDDGGGHASPVGVDIHGRWSGEYYIEGDSHVVITARISQDGDAVVMKTDKAEPPAQSFSGTINEESFIVLTDASDGETWTSYGTVTTTHLTVTDYTRGAHDGESWADIPRQIIDLSRTVTETSTEEDAEDTATEDVAADEA